jgi:hypothetical protein
MQEVDPNQVAEQLLENSEQAVLKPRKGVESTVFLATAYTNPHRVVEEGSDNPFPFPYLYPLDLSPDPSNPAPDLEDPYHANPDHNLSNLSHLSYPLDLSDLAYPSYPYPSDPLSYLSSRPE